MARSILIIATPAQDLCIVHHDLLWQIIMLLLLIESQVGLFGIQVGKGLVGEDTVLGIGVRSLIRGGYIGTVDDSTPAVRGVEVSATVHNGLGRERVHDLLRLVQDELVGSIQELVLKD